MCEITWIYSKNHISNLEERITKMNSSIKLREPDAGSCYLEDQKLALVKGMTQSDVRLMKKEQYLKDEDYKIMNYFE